MRNGQKWVDAYPEVAEKIRELYRQYREAPTIEPTHYPCDVVTLPPSHLIPDDPWGDLPRTAVFRHRRTLHSEAEHRELIAAGHERVVAIASEPPQAVVSIPQRKGFASLLRAPKGSDANLGDTTPTYDPEAYN